MAGNNLLLYQQRSNSWTPAVLSPDNWFRSDNLLFNGMSQVTSFVAKGAFGNNATFPGGQYGDLLTNVADINNKNAVEYGTSASGAVFSNTQSFNDSEPCCFAGVVSAASWSGSYYEFLVLNNGSTGHGIYFTAADTTVYPTYNTLNIYTGDGSTLVVGLAGFGSGYYAKYFWFLVNYNGNGLGTPGNWEVYINGVSQTLNNPGATNSAGTNPSNMLLLTGAVSPSSAAVEFFSKQNFQVTGADLTNLVNYMQSRYGL